MEGLKWKLFSYYKAKMNQWLGCETSNGLGFQL